MFPTSLPPDDQEPPADTTLDTPGEPPKKKKKQKTASPVPAAAAPTAAAELNVSEVFETASKSLETAAPTGPFAQVAGRPALSANTQSDQKPAASLVVYSKEEQAAGKTITRNLAARMRDIRGEVEAEKMRASGQFWRNFTAAEGMKRIADISKHNINVLYNSLVNLAMEDPPDNATLADCFRTFDNAEHDFFRTFMSTKLFATHATDADLVNSETGNVGLLSYLELRHRKIPFDQTHTTDSDISRLADHGHVCFSLEMGDTLQKTSSRFGTNMYRFPFETLEFQQAGWSSLVDIIEEGSPDVSKVVPEVSDDVKRAFSDTDLTRYTDEQIFTNADTKRAIALHIIKVARLACADNETLRGVSDVREQILAVRTPEELNRTMHAIVKPIVRVPKSYFSSEFSQSTVRLSVPPQP